MPPRGPHRLLPTARLFAWLSAWRQRRRDLLELAQADARLLADLGLSRPDIARALGCPCWRDPLAHLEKAARRNRR